MMLFSRFIKWVFRWKTVGYGFLFAVLVAGTVGLSNLWVSSSTQAQLHTSLNEIPANEVGLVLGASRNTRRGTINLYFKYRMEAAAKLYHAGKIKHILVSGDNHIKGYDEPTDMRDYLVELGVPIGDITLDYAGFRTFDSVVRAQKVFGQQSFTIISQPFHNQRAVFIANQCDLDVVAYNAKDIAGRYSIRTQMREPLAKFKAVLDLWVLHKEPKFLGDPVSIELN